MRLQFPQLKVELVSFCIEGALHVSRISWLRVQAFLHLGYEHTAKVRDGFILSRFFGYCHGFKGLVHNTSIAGSQESLQWEHEAIRQCN